MQSAIAGYFFSSCNVKWVLSEERFLDRSFTGADVPLNEHTFKYVMTQCLSGYTKDLQSFSKFRRKTLNP